MFDALGFKGIWGRPGVREDPELVIGKLLRLENEMNGMLDREFGGSRSSAVASPQSVLGQCSLVFLSDTVVLGLATKPAEELEAKGIGEDSYRGWSLVVACRFANAILRAAAATFPELAYRGCITYGEFALEKNFIVGPAVDEAAELMDRAQGAFVWLSPKARKILDDCKLSSQDMLQYGLISYLIPIKGGDQYETPVVFPFDAQSQREVRDSLAARILSTFEGASLDVDVKKQRTEDFLRAASEALERRK